MNLRGQKNSENVYIYKNFISNFFYLSQRMFSKKNVKIRQKIYVQNRGGGGGGVQNVLTKILPSIFENVEHYLQKKGIFQ